MMGSTRQVRPFSNPSCRTTSTGKPSPAFPAPARRAIAWAKSGTYVAQVSAEGPLGLEYIGPIDDPREQSRNHPRRNAPA
jgi:hypothetical protein